MPTKVSGGTSPGSAVGKVISRYGLSCVMRLSCTMMPSFSRQVLNRNCVFSPANPFSISEKGSGSTKVLMLMDASKGTGFRKKPLLHGFGIDVISCRCRQLGTFAVAQQAGLVVVEQIEAMEIEQEQTVISCCNFKYFQEFELLFGVLIFAHPCRLVFTCHFLFCLSDNFRRRETH
ncbi:hypothetical protein [Labrenzia sp. THAF35]|uniref:hypothetical protein n=1 Tax=Labrenzia sp. THAF35 TaxID=2587854 RepID=UPI00126924C6|nr:hypothetical protein [Labrenzia sp. THAF35]